MDDELESAFRTLSDQKSSVCEEKFTRFIGLFHQWMKSLKQSAQMRFIFFPSQRKKMLHDCVSLLLECCKSSPKVVSPFCMNITTIFIDLLNPFNDREILQESWKAIWFIIESLIDVTKTDTWDELFVSIFPFNAEMEAARLNIGSKGQGNFEVFSWENKYLMEFLSKVEDHYDYFFLWRVICRKIMTFIRMLQQTDPTNVRIISNMYISELTSNMKKQNNFSPIGQMPHIPRALNTISGDKSLANEVCWLLSVLEDSSDIFAKLTNDDQCVFDFFEMNFPIENSKIDTSQYPVTDMRHYYLAIYESAPQRRTTDVVSRIATFSKSMDLFSQLISISFRLLLPLSLPSNLMNLISLCTQLRTITHLYNEHCPCAFYPSRCVLLVCMQPPQLFPQLLCYFLSVAYDLRKIDVTTFSESVERLNNCAKQNDMKNQYISIIATFSSQICVSLMKPLFHITDPLPDLKQADDNSVLFENIFIKNSVLEQFSSKTTQDNYMFFSLGKCMFSVQESRQFLLNFLELFDHTMHYILTPIVAETMLSIVSIISPSVLQDVGILCDVILERLFTLFSSKEGIDVNRFANIICKLYISKFMKRPISMKIVVLWTKFAENVIKKVQQHCFVTVYFTAIHAFLNGLNCSFYLVPLLMEKMQLFYRQASEDQKSLLFSFVGSVYLIFRKNQSIKNLTYSKVVQYTMVFLELTKNNPDINIGEKDSIISLLFIDEVNRSKGVFDPFLWDYIKSYISESSTNGYFQPLILLSSKITFLKKVYKIIPSFFDLMLETCARLLQESSLSLSKQIFSFITNSLMVLPHGASDFHAYLCLFTPGEREDEIERARKIECNIFISNYEKLSGVTSLKQPTNKPVILLQLEKEMQLFCELNHEDLSLSVSTNTGSSEYQVSTFGEKRKSFIRPSCDNGEYNGLLGCAVAYSKLPLFIDIISTANGTEFNYLDDSIYADQLASSVQALASRFGQRNQRYLSAISVIYANGNEKDFSDLLSTKWDETSSVFREFVGSLGVLTTPNEIGKIQDVVARMKGSPSIIKITLRHIHIFHIAPLMSDTREAILKESPVAIIWEKTPSCSATPGCTSEIFKKWRNDSALIVISPLKSKYFLVKIICPPGKKLHTIVSNVLVTPAEMLTDIVLMVVSSLNDQMRSIRSRNGSGVFLFKPSWQQFYVN